MALRTVILGWEATCFIGTPTATATSPFTPNYVEFGVRGGRITVDIDDEECGDSITGAVKARKPGRYDASISLDFYERSDIATVTDNPAGLLVAVDDTSAGPPDIEIALKISPQGNSTGDKDFWEFPSFLCSSYQASWNMDGKLEGSISGRSNGVFTPPTN